MALTAAAFGALAAGATGGELPGGTPALLRNLAGMTGIGLLSAAVLGGAFGWTGPMAYLLVAEGALNGLDHTVGLGPPAAARPGRGALRVPGVRRRAGADHRARGPRLRPPVRPRLSDIPLQPSHLSASDGQTSMMPIPLAGLGPPACRPFGDA